MLISSLCFLALASLGTFATPLALPHPEPIPTSPSGLRRSVPLSHTPSHIERARHAHASRQNAKVDRRWSYPVERHEVQERNVDPTWLLREAAKVDTRYNDGSGGFGKLLANEQRKRKRGNGEVSLTDHNLDASYSASMSVGTPAQSFGIILDTGSSDLWFASSNCNSGCDGMTEFNLGQSSSFVNLNTSFSISYGSGKASGTLGQDSVTLGGYTVAAQTFAACSSITSGLISTSASGILGLSWPALAYSKATPWWVTLAQSTAWSQPLFSFYLKRYRDMAGATSSESDGGAATFGYLDSSMYTGSVTYASVPANSEYWQISMGSMSMDGTSISLNGLAAAAVDTGTTLIGGPASIVQTIYAAIPGSQAMTGSYANYYEFPCNSSINFQIVISGFTITITDEDFNLGRYSSDQTLCTGAVFTQTLPSNSPVQWIFGDTVLKNVLSVFRYNPAAVGFAQLSSSETSGASGASTTIPVVSSLDTVPSLTSNSVTSTSSSASHSSSSSSMGSTNNAPMVTITSTESPHVVTASPSSSSSSSASAAQDSSSTGGATKATASLAVAVLGVLGGLYVM